jgi:Xaa-Pro aminopeptidase
MISDLDRLMQEFNLDAIWITGPAQHNPVMYYFTGGAHLTSADLFKKRGGEPILFCNPMERDEAAMTGLQTRNLSDYRWNDILKQNNGNQVRSYTLLYKKILTDLGFTAGRLGLYGKVDAGQAFAVFTGLQDELPGLTVVGQVGDSILLRAMATKTNDEITRMRRMGQITTQVVGQVADFLTSHKVVDNTLIKPDGEALTIADVKSRINLWLAERTADNPEGTIFAIGRDAAIPHSVGNPTDKLQLGQTIIFDIYPCESGGGYFYDFTRTWCLGYAPDEVQSLYEDVRSVYDQIMSELKMNAMCRDYQVRACELFEAKGHPTIKSNPQTQDGYVHGLGHGLGLHIHEYPRFSLIASESDRLVPGVVITVEPGLYYPDRSMGVRLEDTIWVRPDGQMELLAEYPLDLVLPIK